MSSVAWLVWTRSTHVSADIHLTFPSTWLPGCCRGTAPCPTPRTPPRATRGARGRETATRPRGTAAPRGRGRGARPGPRGHLAIAGSHCAATVLLDNILARWQQYGVTTGGGAELPHPHTTTATATFLVRGGGRVLGEAGPGPRLLLLGVHEDVEEAGGLEAGAEPRAARLGGGHRPGHGGHPPPHRRLAQLAQAHRAPGLYPRSGT